LPLDINLGEAPPKQGESVLPDPVFMKAHLQLAAATHFSCRADKRFHQRVSLSIIFLLPPSQQPDLALK